MAIPETIKIGAHQVKVVSGELIDNTVGSFDMQKGLIQLQIGMPLTVTEMTLLHEIVECVSVMHELDIEHSKITALSAALYQVLKENDLFGS